MSQQKPSRKMRKNQKIFKLAAPKDRQELPISKVAAAAVQKSREMKTEHRGFNSATLYKTKNISWKMWKISEVWSCGSEWIVGLQYLPGSSWNDNTQTFLMARSQRSLVVKEITNVW